MLTSCCCWSSREEPLPVSIIHPLDTRLGSETSWRCAGGADGDSSCMCALVNMKYVMLLSSARLLASLKGLADRLFT